MNIGALEWLNEHALTDYPLTKYVGIHDFLLDANFVQFDGFVPVLKQCTVLKDQLDLLIQFDEETKKVSIAKQGFIPETSIEITSNSRYLGCIVLGPGLFTLFDKDIGTVFNWNIPFSSSTVVAVNKEAGVYSIDSLFGNVSFDTGTGIARTIFYGILTENNSSTVIWNAVSLPDSVFSDIVPLKTLNGVHPVKNAVTIKGSELIKITPSLNTLTFGLSTEGTNVIPSRSYSNV